MKMNSEKNNTGLVKVESGVVSKGNKLLALSNKVLTPYYSELRQWWESMDPGWKGDIINYLNLKLTSFHTPKDYELEEIILVEKLKINPFHIDLKPLSKFENLEILIGYDIEELESLQGIEGLPRIKKLELFNSCISDLKPLQNLTTLVHLELRNSLKRWDFLTDLSPIGYLKHLTCLKLGCMSSFDPIDLSCLAGLQDLVNLSISQSYIRDLNFLEKLINLEYIDLYFIRTDVHNLDPCHSLKRLRTLNLGNPSISDIEPLFELPFLELLNVANTSVPERQIIKLTKVNQNCKVVVKKGIYCENGEFKEGPVFPSKFVDFDFCPICHLW